MLHKKMIGIFAMVILASGVSVSVAASGKWKKPDKPKEEKKETQISLPLEMAMGDGLTRLSDASASWPGELVSPTTIEAHPQSEGTIVELNVRVGQKVSRGEILARLSPPPASIERANASSEKKQMLIRAQANADATARLVAKSKVQFLEARKSLIPARDAAIALNQKETDRIAYLNESSVIQLEKMKQEKNAAVELATKERDQATLNMSLKERTLRVSLQQTIEKNLQELTTWVHPDVMQILKGSSLQFKYGVGLWDQQSRYTYEKTLFNTLQDLQKTSSSLLDESALTYAQAFKILVYSTNTSDAISSTNLESLKNMARKDQEMLTDASNEKRDSERMAQVKEAELQKMIAERDKEVTESSINEKQARISSESNEITRKKGVIDSELEYQNRVREIDVKIIELDRDLELARAEVRAAKSAYQTFIEELSSQTVIAQRAGTVSGIFKNTGDYVTPETVVATISQDNTQDAFIRFRIPSDAKLPEVGSEVTISRPSFPFDRRMAIIVGVGGILGENGAFTAEAEFTEDVDWPIHALIRVTSSEKTASILIPFTALRWDENNQSHIYVAVSDTHVADRIIKTGKAVGDKIEVTEGLKPKEMFLSRQIPESVLKTILVKGDEAQNVEMKKGTSDTSDKEDSGEASMEDMGHGE
ncbi:biotin/lipoyl-binding protein [Candidatus Uhrbacteria bacterium]|nr:biotin/lipoyl-binding protein [Candidatus Uhrbacteria bacterium]